MKKEELYNIARVSISIASVIAILYLSVSGKPTLKEILRGVSFGVTTATTFWLLYNNWLWKFIPFNKLINRPNLNGTWKGVLVSDWKNDNGEGVPPKEIFIVIRQNFLNLHITSFTDNFMGVSYVESLLIDKEKGVKKVIYIYKKETSDLGKQESNEGTCELRIIQNDKRLEGKYWTNIKTNGVLKLEKLLDSHIETYSEGVKALDDNLKFT